MQTLASYMFDAELDQHQVDDRFEILRRELRSWLASKGANDIVNGLGEFRSLTGDNIGKFSIEALNNSAGSLESVKLVEEAHNGQIFITTAKIVSGPRRIEVWATLSVTGAEMLVAPNDIIPRCPTIIRNIISLYSDWRFGGQPLPRGEAINAGADIDIATICERIIGASRTLPLIAISRDEDEEIWPDISVILARDLIGLADVFVIDSTTSWNMTELIGANLSCYLGAIKLFWPKRNIRRQNPIYDYWLPEDMHSFGANSAGMKRFASFIRAKIMAVAAQNVVGSKLVRDIHTAAAREKLAEFKAGVVEKELDFLVNENDEIRQELTRKDEKIFELEGSIEAYKERYAQLESKYNATLSVTSPNESDLNTPRRGDVRFYKKIGNKNGIDIMVHVNDCGHREGAWKPGFKGDQAEKGIARLEGANNWQSLKHCGTCTGGGRWRVRW